MHLLVLNTLRERKSRHMRSCIISEYSIALKSKVTEIDY